MEDQSVERRLSRAGKLRRRGDEDLRTPDGGAICPTLAARNEISGVSLSRTSIAEDTVDVCNYRCVEHNAELRGVRACRSEKEPALLWKRRTRGAESKTLT